jgi:protein-S-isoprenylcysteine O-methyltransferase Ste14
MPLSEHEERILAEIERQLAAEDPRFVARARKRKHRSSRTLRLRLAISLVVIGFLSLLGLVAHITFGVVGMLLLLAGIVLGATALRESAEEARGAHVPPDERS